MFKFSPAIVAMVICGPFTFGASAAKANGQWCSPAPFGKEACGGTPAEACEKQNEAYNPEGGIKFLGTEPRFPEVARCLWRREPGKIGGQGLASAFFTCAEGLVLSGRACLPRVANPSPTCNAGGNNHTTKNPINILTGAKFAKGEIWSTADNRMKVEYLYNS